MWGRTHLGTNPYIRASGEFDEQPGGRGRLGLVFAFLMLGLVGRFSYILRMTMFSFPSPVGFSVVMLISPTAFEGGLFCAVRPSLGKAGVGRSPQTPTKRPITRNALSAGPEKTDLVLS